MPYDQYSWPQVTSTIASGQSLGDIINNGKANVIGFIMPPGWTAGNMTFQASVDGTNFFDLYDQAGNEVSIPVAANRFVGGLDVLAFGNFNYFRPRSGTSSVPVNQAADRVITFVFRNAGGF